MSLYGRGYIDGLKFIAHNALWHQDYAGWDAPDDRVQYKRGWEDGLRQARRVASDAVGKLAEALEDALKMSEGEA